MSGSGSFVSDHQGRDTEMTGELALDDEGRFLALRVTGYANVGGALLANGPGMSTTNVVKNVTSVYRTPLLHVLTRNMFTNTTPIGAYRGAGRPESNYLMERLIETAALETGRDADALRRLNHVRPEELPYKAASGTDLRQRQFHRGPRPRFADCRLGRLRRAARRKPGRAAGCAAAASASISKARRRRTRRWAASASRPTGP